MLIAVLSIMIFYACIFHTIVALKVLLAVLAVLGILIVREFNN
jgi:hypothetical protein